MDLSQKLDLVVVVIANLLNLILSLIFLNRVFGRAAWEHWLGYGTLIMVFPLTIIAIANLVDRRSWAFWVLPLIVVAFLALEFDLDYWLRFDFRHTAWLVWWERQAAGSRETATKKESPLVAEIVKAVMTACLAYVGYAVVGLLLAFLANTRAAESGTGGVDIEAAGANLKMQFMFVVAFLVNTATVFWIARRWQKHRIALGAAFLLFWFLDAAVPWLYQTLVLGSSFIPTAFLLGLLPAAILVLSLRMNYRQIAL